MLWTYTQNSFVGGQLDRKIRGRQDLSKYFQGASKISNFIIDKQGSITKRSGTNFALDITSVCGTKFRLIPLAHDRSTSMYILLSNGMAYLLRRGANGWTKSGGVSTRVDETGAYNNADLDDISIFQSGNTIFLAHQAYTVRKIVYSVTSGLTVSSLEFNQGTIAAPRITLDKSAFQQEVVNESVAPQGGQVVKTRTVTTYLKDSSGNGIGKKKVATTSYIYTHAGGSVYVWVPASFSEAEYQLPTRTVEYAATSVKDGVESPLSATVRFTYNAPWLEGDNVRIIIHPAPDSSADYFNVYKKTSTDFGLIGSTKNTGAVEPPAPIKPNVKVTLHGNGGKLAGGAEEKEIEVAIGGRYDLASADPTREGFVCDGWIVGGTETIVHDGDYLVRDEAHDLLANWIEEVVEEPDPDPEPEPQSAPLALVAEPRLAANAEEYYITDDYITPDMSVSPPTPMKTKMFVGTNQNPSCVSIYQQRLMFASTRDEPFSYWLSSVGDLYLFSTHSPLMEDDAIKAELSATEFPKINHIVVGRDILVFGESGEWKIAPVGGNALTYKTVSATKQSAIGAAKSLYPMTVGEQIVFAESTREALRSISFNYASEGYDTKDLSVLAEDIFRGNPIVSMCYKQNPNQTIYCVLADGSIATLVYLPEHDVVAWGTHKFADGWKAMQVACNKSIRDGESHIVFVVKKESTIELWEERTSAESDKNSLFADRVVGSTGNAFESSLVTVYPEIKGGQDSLQMEIANPTEARVRCLDATSFKIRALGNPKSSAKSITISSKRDIDVRAVLSGINTRDPRIVITHDGVGSLTILSLAITYQVEPENRNGGAQ